jgi:hypothetical protein
MRFMILFDGKTYVTERVPGGVSADSVMEEYPAHCLLEFAVSEEDAVSKIQQDRDRHRVDSY